VGASGTALFSTLMTGTMDDKKKSFPKDDWTKKL
jgi:hypothetical protein